MKISQKLTTENFFIGKYFVIACLLFISPVVLSADNVANSGKAESMTSAQKSVIIFGASYAKNLQIDTISGRNVINKGIGGNETQEMVSRFHDDVIKLQPEAVIIWGFINDIHRAEAGKLDEKLKQIKLNFESMVKDAVAAGITPVLATEVTITSPAGIKEWLADIIGSLLGKESYVDYVNQHVMNTNIWLKDFATRSNIQILDFENVLKDSDDRRKREYAVDDGSHLTEEAYLALRSYIKEQDFEI